MKQHLSSLAFCFLTAFLFVSCQGEPDPAPELGNYLKVAEGLSDGSSFKVEILSPDSLFVGYNAVFIKVTDQAAGQPLSRATLAFHPLMDMGDFSHACPTENPSSIANTAGYFQGAVLFSMPGVNTWSLGVNIFANGKSETVLLPLAKVCALSPARKIVVIDSLSTGPGSWTITRYPVSLVRSKPWQVGANPFEITVHRMESMMSFPPVTDLTVEISPEMPSMGHGSPNNIHPVHTENGHYLGSVNFTMTGDWRIHLKLSKGGRQLGSNACFDVHF